MPNQQNKNTALSSFIGIGIIILLVFSAIGAFLYLSKTFFSAKTPQYEIPVIDNTPKENLHSIELLNQNYTPSIDVFSNSDKYNKESILFAVNGNFDRFILNIKGKGIEDGKHFTLININNLSGILNGVRNSPNSIDLLETESHGGIFKDENNFSNTLDFMNDTALSTTTEEFKNTNQRFKLVKLWDYVAPKLPTVARLLIAPFNEDGNFGGATITSLQIQYSCKGEPNSCKVVICPKDKKFTECLQNNFGTY